MRGFATRITLFAMIVFGCGPALDLGVGLCGLTAVGPASLDDGASLRARTTAPIVGDLTDDGLDDMTVSLDWGDDDLVLVPEPTTPPAQQPELPLLQPPLASGLLTFSSLFRPPRTV